MQLALKEAAFESEVCLSEGKGIFRARYVSKVLHLARDSSPGQVSIQTDAVVFEAHGRYEGEGLNMSGGLRLMLRGEGLLLLGILGKLLHYFRR